MFVVHDLKYVLRLLMKKPVFAATTIVIMTVGLALTIYMYTLLNTLLYKPLDMKGGDSLVRVIGGFDPVHLSQRSLWAYVARRIKEDAQSFDMVSIFNDGGGTALISGRDSANAAKKLNSTFTEWRIFEMAGVQPILGRALQAEDHYEGAEPVIVLSHSVWKNLYSEDPSIVDRIINVDAEPTRIVGVMPEGFAFPNYAETWQATAYDVLNPTDQSRRGTDAVARLKPDVTFDQAAAEMKKIEQILKKEFPDNAPFIRIELIPFKMSRMQEHTPMLIALSVVVLLILLLACINVGNLLLSRVNERIKEVAIRVALGVPRSRLVMQMLLESIIICVFSGVVAVLLAAWGLEITNIWLDTLFAVDKSKPFWWDLSIDGDTLFALSGIVLFTILLTGAVPAWRAMTGDFNAVLRDGTRGALSKKSARVAQVLVVSEILLSCVVLVVASLILTMTYQASKADYGIDPTNTLTAWVELPAVNYVYWGEDEAQRHAMDDKRNQFFERFRMELQSEPNIVSLSSMSDIPGTGGGWNHFDVEGKEYPELEAYPKSNNEVVVIGSLQAMGLELREGRYFDSRDSRDKDERVIISESLAKELYQGESAIGKRTRWMRDDRSEYGPWRTIIGVVSDVIHDSALRTSSMVNTTYHAHLQSGGLRNRFRAVIRYQGPEAQARKTMDRVLKRIDPDVPIYDVQTYQRVLEEGTFIISNVSKLFLFCGLIAIFLAATGIYAVVSNSISQRTQEIGVRRAVGATDKKVLSLFFSKSTWQLIWGIGFGIAVAIFATIQMSDMWVIQSVAYMVAYIFVPILIAAIVLGATYIPTSRALKVEPSEALHYE